ncbi:MAG TPA: YggS family pyridoxal phosphate-dependent enzyme [Firmicutes bacterium]|nr:YggS family pyridoxal phosphate-dependent enzyme [Bacillota bacterium]
MTRTPESVRINTLQLLQEVRQTAEAAGRAPNSVQVMAVTKTVEPALVNVALQNGIRLLGENRSSELLEKYQAYQVDADQIHFIGHLQTNKVKYIIDKVSMIESLDSIRLAQTIQSCAALQGITMDVLVQINIGNEPSKSGIRSEELEDFLGKLVSFSALRVRGLMAIPPKENYIECFAKMQKIFVDTQGKTSDNITMEHLSMGMTSDYKDAIRYGSTIVRIGTGLFGQR